MKRLFQTVLIALSSCAPIAASDPVLASDANHPTVVELFQSQGCSSCPPAIANVNRIAGRSDILALTFAVTYWDQLGWKDTFARPEFTERERDYARTGVSQFATPQTVVNGRATVNGGNFAQLVAAIRGNDRGTSGPAITSGSGKAMIGKADSREPATIWLIRYDPRPVSVPIRAGENGGRTIVHRNVVRSLLRLGAWRGAPVTVALPSAPEAYLRSAILVQAGRGGAIIAAARLSA